MIIFQNHCDVCGSPVLRKEATRCSDCGKLLCQKDTFRRVDGNNRSITKNALPYCRECGERRGI